ncbi:hypothetical protein CERSUDRAFT_136275 [Gelatoporia subvermispora B]|uniref:BTB domain-containing protein n=1 Tax=Ceriporiopsis subvermispora (strain B) TaxID=914234 RepID=M2QZG8_CERS8|nr:hypothetical protein CERSUDRAFT_136275 [Gelatoporia subvermispora B]
MDSLDWMDVLQIAPNGVEDAEKVFDGPVALEGGTANWLPTPPPSESDRGSPKDTDNDADDTVSVSIAFHPEANLSEARPDLALLSSDGIFFYVHSYHVLAASSNNFASLLPASPGHVYTDHGPIIPVPESGDVINVVAHTIYNIPCSHYTPSIDTLIASVHAMHKYGMPLKSLITPSTLLFSLILAQAPLAPIQFYALAGAYDLDDLTVTVSSHLLAYHLSSLTDELATRMGPVYLKRLFFLHLGRMEALRRLLLMPPRPHPSSAECNFADQRSLTRAWALASAYLAWEARPDMSTSAMESALYSMGSRLSCPECKKSLSDRVKELVIQWSIIKRTV